MKTQEACGFYDSAHHKAMIIPNIISFGTVLVNYMIRTVMIMLISWIGYPSETEKLNKITRFTFYMVFFNTGFLLMLVNADMSE